MVAFNQLASVILAAIFISIFAGLYINYQHGAAERDFMQSAESLAERVRTLKDRDAGTTDYFSINVPANCELRFYDNMIFATAGSWSENHDVGVAVSGPTLANQRVQLKLERLDNGVSVSAIG